MRCRRLRRCQFPDHFRRVAKHDRVWWNISSDDGARSNDGVVADRDAFQDHGAGAEPYVIADSNWLRDGCRVLPVTARIARVVKIGVEDARIG